MVIRIEDASAEAMDFGEASMIVFITMRVVKKCFPIWNWTGVYLKTPVCRVLLCLTAFIFYETFSKVVQRGIYENVLEISKVRECAFLLGGSNKKEYT